MTYRTMLLVVMLSIPVTALSLLAYHRFAAPQRIGVVDVAALWSAGQSDTAAVLMRPDATDEQKRAAMADAQRYGERLQAALRTVGRDCDCLLLTANAVLTSRAPDYTSTVAVALKAPSPSD